MNPPRMCFLSDNVAFVGAYVGTQNPESRSNPVFVLQTMNEAFVGQEYMFVEAQDTVEV